MGSNIIKNREKLYAYYSSKQSHNVQNKWNRTIVERNEDVIDRPFIFYEDMNGKLIATPTSVVVMLFRMCRRVV